MNISGIDITIERRSVSIGRLSAEKFDFLAEPEVALADLRRAKVPIDLFTFLQHPRDTRARYCHPMELDNLAALPVLTYDAWWSKHIDNKTRNMVRRSEKRGVEVREVPFDERLVDGIWKIYNECPVRQGRRFSHYGKGVETVKKEAATFLDRSVFIGAFHDTQLIGFIKMTSDRDRTLASIMNIIAMIQQRDKAPVNALIAQAVRSCAERQLSQLIYSNFAYGQKRPDSLAEFKRNNGFRRLDVPRYYVPFTRIGSIAFTLGLHKRLVDHVPELILTRVRELRNAWYHRFLSQKCNCG